MHRWIIHNKVFRLKTRSVITSSYVQITVMRSIIVQCSVTDLISSFSRGLLSTTTHGRSDSAGLAAGRGGDSEGDALPRIFRLVFGVASLFWTRWGNRSRRICSRSSSTIYRVRVRNTHSIQSRSENSFQKSSVESTASPCSWCVPESLSGSPIAAPCRELSRSDAPDRRRRAATQRHCGITPVKTLLNCSLICIITVDQTVIF